MAREVDAKLGAGVLDRRRVMRYALGTVAGAIAVPVLTACGGSAANTTSSTSSSATSSSSSSVVMPAALPPTYKATWPLNVAKSQVAVPGSMYVTQNGALEMASFGNDMWGTGDNFAYYNEKVSGDGEWSVEVAIQANTNEWAKAGIMLRQSLDPTDAFIDLVTSPQHGVFVNYRGVKGKAAPNSNGPTIDAVAATPIFLKLSKKGTQVTVSDSPDGQTWNNTTVLNMIAFDPSTGQVPKPAAASTSASGSASAAAPAAAAIPTNPIPLLTDPFYVGLCACSHDPKLRGRVGFDQITGFKNPTYTSVYQTSLKNNW